MATESAQGSTNSTPRWRLLVLVLAGTVLDGANLYVFTTFIPDIARSFGVSVVPIAAMQTASYLAGLLGAMVIGPIADRYGRRLGLAVSVAVFSLASVASAEAHTLSELFVARTVAGLAMGGEVGVGLVLLNEGWSPRRRGTATGLFQLASASGTIIAAWLFAIAHRHYGASGWRWALGLLGGGAILAAVIRWLIPESPIWAAPSDRKNPSPFPAFAWSPPLIWFTVLAVFAFFGTTPLSIYAPTVWLSIYHTAAARFATLATLASLVAFLGYLLVGHLSDRWGRRRVFVTTALVGAAGYIGYAALVVTGWDRKLSPVGWNSPLLWLVLWVVFSYGYLAVLGSWLAETFPTAIRATAVDLVVCVGRGIGSGIAPLAVLTVATQWGGDARFAVASGVIGMVVAGFLGLRLRETRGRDLAAATGWETSRW
jgi:MFS family permease